MLLAICHIYVATFHKKRKKEMYAHEWKTVTSEGPMITLIGMRTKAGDHMYSIYVSDVKLHISLRIASADTGRMSEILPGILRYLVESDGMWEIRWDLHVGRRSYTQPVFCTWVLLLNISTTSESTSCCLCRLRKLSQS